MAPGAVAEAGRGGDGNFKLYLSFEKESSPLDKTAF